MSDIFSGGPLGFFFGNDKADPRVNQQLRQRIALAMMARGTKYPKNIGEGLSAIGEAIGDRGLMRQIEQGDLAQQEQARGLSPPGSAPAAASTAAPSSYAPSGGTPTAPAVQAIEAATTPTPPPPAAVGPLTTAPSELTATPMEQQPASMLSPEPMLNTPIQTPPATGFNRVPTAPRGAGPQASAGYNMIDAQAGFKPGRTTPGYIQDAIVRNVKDPDMQAYYGSLVAGEAPNGPRDTSSTGARGPFQFTRGTARQYGLANPEDLDASTQAAQKFTQDNAATFERINGRPPTMAELAVMHQQGGVTGANMIAGTGNAPPGNLAVNNIDPNAGPAQAVARIKGYYGMPDRPVNSRDKVAAAMLDQQGGGVPPIVAQGGDEPPLSPQSAIAPQPSGIRAAPPIAPQIKPVPTQVAQAGPQSDFGYVMPEVAKVKSPDQTPIGKTEAWAIQQKLENPNNDYIQRRMDAIIGVEAANRVQKDKTNNEAYTADLTKNRELEMKRQGQIETQAQRQAEGAKKASDAEIYKRTGQSPEQFYPEMKEQKTLADQAISAQDAQQLARKAIRSGVITGYGANGMIASAKFADWAFKNGMKGDLAANTETMTAALKFGLTDAIQTINGVGGKVSDSDLKIAQGMQATDPGLQMKTIQTILDRASSINNTKINRYEEKVNQYLAGHPQELNYATNARPVAPPDKLKLLLDSQQDPAKADTMKAHFDEAYGPGSADLQIARFQRSQRRKPGG